MAVNIYTNLPSRDVSYVPTEQKMPFQAYAAVGAQQQKRSDDLYTDIAALDYSLENMKFDDPAAAKVYGEARNQISTLTDSLTSGEYDVNRGVKELARLSANLKNVGPGTDAYKLKERKTEYDTEMTAGQTAAGKSSIKAEFNRVRTDVDAQSNPYVGQEDYHLPDRTFATHIDDATIEKRANDALLRLGTEKLSDAEYKIVQESMELGNGLDETMNLLYQRDPSFGKRASTIKEALIGSMVTDTDLTSSLTDEVAAEVYNQVFKYDESFGTGPEADRARIKAAEDFANREEGQNLVYGKLDAKLGALSKIAAREAGGQERLTRLKSDPAIAAGRKAQEDIKKEVYYLDKIPGAVTYTPAQGYDVMTTDINEKTDAIKLLDEKINSGYYEDSDLEERDRLKREKSALVSNIRKQNDNFKYVTDEQGNIKGDTPQYTTAKKIAAEVIADQLNSFYEEDLYDADKLLNGTDKQKKQVENMVEILLESPDIDNSMFATLASVFPSQLGLNDADGLKAIKDKASGRVKELFMSTTKSVPDVVYTLADSYRDKVGNELPSAVGTYEEDIKKMVLKEGNGFTVTGGNGKTFDGENSILKDISTKMGIPIRLVGNNPNFTLEVNAIERELGEGLQFVAKIKPNDKLGKEELDLLKDKWSLYLGGAGRSGDVKTSLDYVISPKDNKVGLQAEDSFINNLENMISSGAVKTPQAVEFIQNEIDYNRAAKSVGEFFTPAITVDYHNAWEYVGDTHNAEGVDISGDMESKPIFLKDNMYIRKGKDTKSKRGGRQDNYEIVKIKDDKVLGIYSSENQSITDAMVDLYRISTGKK